VRELIVRDKNLMSFNNNNKLDLSLFNNLEILSLSHNLLTDIRGILLIPTLQEINLNNNKIDDLSPLSECVCLKKLWFAHNDVNTI
jgi:Leucine-rich repeat (LRR) protein